MPLQKKRIKFIQFGLFSPQALRSSSACQIYHPDTLQNGIPRENGLIDLRMGTTERQYLCGSCNENTLKCPGHFGHIELAKPVFHVGYISRIKKLLETICFYCSKIKTLPDNPIENTINNTIETKPLDNPIDSTSTAPNLPNSITSTNPSITFNPNSLAQWWSLNKSKSVCMHCHSKQPLIKRDGLSLYAFLKGEENTEGKILLNGEKVLLILKRISDIDCNILGFSHLFARPENMILTVLNVPCMSVRPSVILDGTLRGEDDLTHKLSDILKCNINLEKYEKEGAPGHIIRDYENLLQYHIATFIDNDLPGLPQSLQKNGRPLKSISNRLKGKEGRIRGNLMGKRVDFSARSVISPDSNISLNEIGIPLKVAKCHTFPEKVNSFNKKRLQKLIDNGPFKYPGANYLIREDGQKIDLRYNKNNTLALTIGCMVERHMTNKDIVLFNRQPSLHKMSMMAHTPKIMPGKTFRLNLSTTTPYNADFDGDEMNLHMPQSYNTKAELSHLIKVDKHVISPQANKPVMGIVQDSLVGVRILTDQNIFIKEYDVHSLSYRVVGSHTSTYEGGPSGLSTSNSLKLKRILNRPAMLRPLKLWTGKQIFSLLLPPISYKRGEVLIENGILLYGCIDKTIVGTSQSSLIHILSLQKYEMKYFFDSLQQVVTQFLLLHGFSMGIQDTVTDKNTNQLINQQIIKTKQMAAQLIDQTRYGLLKKQPGMNIKQTFESQMLAVLNKARDVSGKYAAHALKKERKLMIKDPCNYFNRDNSTSSSINSYNENSSSISSPKENSSKENSSNISSKGSSSINSPKGNSHNENSANNILMMVNAGSKGSWINISQITAMVGQQNVEGKRIPFSQGRTLPHFHRDDNRPESRGFVENSYLSGLRPDEFFFHAMGGREGLIDTAIKTAETGYIQRRLIKSLENCRTEYDWTVRAEEQLISFQYGDDSFDASKLERINIRGMDYFLPFNFNRLLNGGWGREKCSKEYLANIYKNIIMAKGVESYDDNGISTLNRNNSPVPTNITEMENILTRKGSSSLSNLSKSSSLGTLSSLSNSNLNDLTNSSNSNTPSKWPNLKYAIPSNFTFTQKHKIIYNLLDITTNPVIHYYILNNINKLLVLEEEELLSICQSVINSILSAFIPAHEMVGTLASQSIGEPATQMTLNTFHFAGIASTMTMGVPRFIEIINLATNIKTPSMTVRIRNGIREYEKQGSLLRHCLEDDSHNNNDDNGSYNENINDDNGSYNENIKEEDPYNEDINKISTTDTTMNKNIIPAQTNTSSSKDQSPSGSEILSESKRLKLENDKLFANRIRNTLEYKEMRNIILNISLWYDPAVDQTVIQEDFDLVQAQYLLMDAREDLSPWLIRMKMDRNRMIQLDLELDQIKLLIERELSLNTKETGNEQGELIRSTFENIYSVHSIEILTSDINSTDWIVRLRLSIGTSEQSHRLFMDRLVGMSIGGMRNISKVFLVLEPEKENIDVIQGVKQIMANISDDLEVRDSRGLNTLTNQTYDYTSNQSIKNLDGDLVGYTDNQSIKHNNKYDVNQSIKHNNKYDVNQYTLQTHGTNLQEILIDPLVVDCYSNDIHETGRLLGIEAAREVILNELQRVLQSDGSYVNIRHLLVLVDIMTFTGKLLGITRHGINRQMGSPLMRCTFEETVEILLGSSCKAEQSHMKTVSEGIMTGQIVHCGTGSTELILDMDSVAQERFSFLEKGEAPFSPCSVLNSPYGSHSKLKGTHIPSHLYNHPDSPSEPVGSNTIYDGRVYNSPLTSPSDNLIYSTGDYSPLSPKYTPMSPKYSPMSPKYSPMSPKYSPTSPKYSPTTPAYSPKSVKYSPLSPKRKQKDDEE